MSIVSDNMRKIISGSGMKQKAIAAKCGYSEKELSAMLCGRKKISADDIPNITRALGVSPNDLYELVDTAGGES